MVDGADLRLLGRPGRIRTSLPPAPEAPINPEPEPYIGGRAFTIVTRRVIAGVVYLAITPSAHAIDTFEPSSFSWTITTS